MEIKSHKDLIVWQKAMDLVTEIYQITSNFPKTEIYGLTSQIRRSAISIPSNISEGKNRGSIKDYRQFLIIAYASAAELDTQLDISQRLKYLSDKNYYNIQQKLQEIMKILYKIIHSL